MNMILALQRYNVELALLIIAWFVMMGDWVFFVKKLSELLKTYGRVDWKLITILCFAIGIMVAATFCLILATQSLLLSGW